MFGRAKPRKLKDQAQAAVSKGKHRKALEAYLELERLEPKAGDWSRRAGEMYRSMEQPGDAIGAWTRAVDRYAEAGFLVKAVAVCQMILRLDPEHTDSQRRLVALNAARGIAVAKEELDTAEVSRVEAADAAPEPPAIDVPPRRRTLPPGAALEEISLKDSVPGSVAVEDLLGSSADEGAERVFEIPIDIELDEEFEEILADPEEDAAEDALSHTPLFSDLSEPVLHNLIGKVELVELEAGQALFKQGDEGRELYVVADGEVAVVDEGPPRVHLTSLGEGAFFGEVALVTSQPRTATIEATEPTQLLAIRREVLSDLIEQEPAVLKVLLRFLRDRLLDNLVRSSPLFSPFGQGEKQQLASRFRFLEVESDTVLIMQGHKTKGMYILLSGAAEVVRHEDDGIARRLATLGSGELVGEMSLLANSDAVATVKTTSKSLALLLPAEVFREVIMTHPQVLMYISEVADERKRVFDQIVSGDADFQTTRLELV